MVEDLTCVFYATGAFHGNQLFLGERAFVGYAPGRDTNEFCSLHDVDATQPGSRRGGAEPEASVISYSAKACSRESLGRKSPAVVTLQHDYSANEGGAWSGAVAKSSFGSGPISSTILPPWAMSLWWNQARC